MKNMKEWNNETSLSPLSRDVELRRPGTEPVTLSGGLRPLVLKFTEDLVNAIDRLKEISQDARRCRDSRAEAAILCKIADAATNVLRLAKHQSSVESRHDLTQEDLPDWNSLSPQLAEKLAPLLEQAAEELRQR